MKSFLRWLLSVIGYSVYTLVVIVALLWFLFPSESFRGWLETELNNQSESLDWQISDMYPAWPLSIVASDIKVLRKESSEQLVQINELKVMPDLAGLGRIAKQWPLTYRARTMSGTISGNASLEKKKANLKCSGEIHQVQVAEMQGFWNELGRKGSGELSGSFTIMGEWPISLSDDIQADLSLNNGSLQLLQPVFGLEVLEFNRLTTTLALKERIATLENGKVDSDLFGAEFSGSVTLADNFLGSGLDITGSFEPRPELLGGLKDAAVMQLIRGQLRENKLTFTLTDTLLEPGLLFQGVSGVIDGLIQGGGR